MTTILRWGTFALMLGILAGCDRGPKLYRVTGTVYWDGKPIADGRINMLAEDGKTSPATAQIVDGKFELMTTAGMKKVEITNRVNKGYDQVMKQEIITNEIPSEYFGGESKLRFDVKETDENVYDLKLPLK